MKKKRFKKEKLRRGIYILPNIFTSLNIFCGFYAVIASINNNFVAAATAIIIAGVFDMLDGKIARATHSTSKFGVEYDSLADLISFGLAPAVVMYLWVLRPMGRIGWLAAFLFMVCGALRLARFNTQFGSVSSDHFVGLPIPAGAGMNAVTILFCHQFGMGESVNPIVILVMLYVLSFLMVSTIKYESFKRPELFKKMNFNVLVTTILVLIFIAAQHELALFLIGLAYVTSGPFTAIWRYKMKTQKNESEKTDELENV
ncbi:CDP-diacylglycerol--serine O-phosphatidyltransferase [Desulfonema magnum]|uniref:CDP-diacylglycerol--serine O-phosphatidyltransferase n=1 Tax=Desulfonema magnum TaxID=45655 RepID=A0A975BG06_9BACT|nr:CDP-diacylglycerol--serine O-phosphatidyltransferase [Desulfonema magnum]QTA84618.1 CDP-diacylglycerol--serine O-phosphatidyltransferase [Desulfonema magnum]